MVIFHSYVSLPEGMWLYGRWSTDDCPGQLNDVIMASDTITDDT